MNISLNLDTTNDLYEQYKIYVMQGCIDKSIILIFCGDNFTASTSVTIVCTITISSTTDKCAFNWIGRFITPQLCVLNKHLYHSLFAQIAHCGHITGMAALNHDYTLWLYYSKTCSGLYVDWQWNINCWLVSINIAFRVKKYTKKIPNYCALFSVVLGNLA